MKKGKYLKDVPGMALAGLRDGLTAGVRPREDFTIWLEGPDRHPGNKSEVDEREDN